MHQKLSKKDQLQIIQYLRYGSAWFTTTKPSLLPYEYTSSQPYENDNRNDNKNNEENQQSMTSGLLDRNIKYCVNGQMIGVTVEGLERKVKEYIVEAERHRQGNEHGNRQKFLSINFEEEEYCLQDRYFSQANMRQVCHFCLCNTHKISHQPQCQHTSLCLQCYTLGHPTPTCPYSSPSPSPSPHSYCSNCQRKHLKSQQQDNNNSQTCWALAKNTEEKKQLFSMTAYYKCADIRCIRCRGWGHLSCGG